MANFDEEILMCLKDLVGFADSFKKIHDTSNCPVNICALGSLADELYKYVHSGRRSLRLVKFQFLSLCKKYHQTINESFDIAKNKGHLIAYFTKKGKHTCDNFNNNNNKNVEPMSYDC